MNFSTAKKIDETFTLDKDFNVILAESNKKLDDPMCKGYVYANLFFYDEVQKEIEKLRGMIKKLHDEVVLELGLSPDDPTKLMLEISMRARLVIGDDGLDALIKEFLAEKGRHIALVPDYRERSKYDQVCEAIFIELTAGFFKMTLQSARDLEGGLKMFKLAKDYVDKMTVRQKRLFAPAIRMIGFENQVKLNSFDLSADWTIKYAPEYIPANFKKQEITIKEQIKSFVQNASGN